MTRPGLRLLALAALGVGVLLCILAGVSQRLPDDIGSMGPERTKAYVGWAGAAGVVFAAAVAVVTRAPPGPGLPVPAILPLGAAMRLAVFVPPPLLSTDVYRYVWDGRVQAAGVNPYRYLPVAPELEPLRDQGTDPAAIYSNINRADFAPAIYPPAAQALFARVGLVWPTIWGMKAAMLAFDAVTAAAALLLLRTARLPGSRVLIYAWNPLVVWEFAGGTHVDAAAIGLSALAVLAVVRCRPALAGAALGLAVLCKLLPAALFPALWRRWDLLTPLAFGAVIAAGYACYALGSWGAEWRVLGYLPGYASEEGLGDSGAFPAASWHRVWACAVMGGAGLRRLGAARTTDARPGRRAAALAYRRRRACRHHLPRCLTAGDCHHGCTVAALPLVSDRLGLACRAGAPARCSLAHAVNPSVLLGLGPQQCHYAQHSILALVWNSGFGLDADPAPSILIRC